MKILHITYSDTYGGANIAARRLCEALRSQGITSDMLVIEKKSKAKYIFKYYYLLDSFSHKIRPYIQEIIRKFFFNQYISINFLPSYLRNKKYLENYDIIHLHWINNEMFSLKDIFEISKNRNLVWTLHDMWPFQNLFHYEDLENKNKILKYLENNMSIKNKISKNIYYIAPSRWMKKKALKKNINTKKIVKIYNTLNIKLSKLENKDTYKKFKKINKYNILLFGSASPFEDTRKNFDEVVKNLETLKEKISNFKVVVFGKYKKNFYDKDIIQVGYLNFSELKYLYSISKVLLLTSKQDNLPNVILEAQSCGLPICSIGEGGHNEIIINNYNGYKLKNLNSVSELNKIKNCINDNKRLRYNSKNYAKKNFDNKIITKQHLKLYNKIINS